jgi:phosphoribosylformylglycinamidine synthase subunit PurL
VVNVKGTDKALLLTTDCNARYVHADPEIGCAIAVAEAARNIVCTGGEPSAITNCLNFGNPYSPEVYWQFVGAIKGMTTACKKFSTPVTGGNVSFYNQTAMGNTIEPIHPTPVIGMLGVLPDKKFQTTLEFKKAGDKIFLLGKSYNDISSSEYLYSYHKVKLSPPPHFDLDEEYKLQDLVKELVKTGLTSSVHDVSDGGLFVTLAESCMPNNFGFNIESDSDVRLDAFLFGESQSRVVVSVSPKKEDAFIEFLLKSKNDFIILGKVTANGDIRIDDEPYGNIKHYKEYFDTSLEKYLK